VAFSRYRHFQSRIRIVNDDMHGEACLVIW
jgi:hypothetical protein